MGLVMSSRAVKVIEGGKLVIPAQFRRAMGIAAGDTLVVEIMPDGDLRIRSLAAAVKRAQSIVGGFIKGRGSMAGELMAERKAAAERE